MARPKKKPEAAADAAPAPSAEIVPIKPAEAGTQVLLETGKQKVRWTQIGEQKRAFSEHGRHKAGEVIETAHADMLIKRKFAEPC